MMRVDAAKLKKGSSELTPECRHLIEQIFRCRNHGELMHFLEGIQVWVYGKCELYHWIDILDRFDEILEKATVHNNGNEFLLNCDTNFSSEDLRLLLLVLNFTTLLIEHSFSRHLYNSIEHLTELLSSQNMDIVLAVLNLLYMFSKRSNFIPRLSFEKKEVLLIKLFNIAERWGDPNYGLALLDCCLRKPKFEYLYQLFIEYMDDNGQTAMLEIPDMMNISTTSSPPETVKIICQHMSNPSDAVKMRIAHRVRLVSGFKDYKLRLKFVQARLQAVSVLIYSNALQENIDKVLYPGFGEELCELIDKEDSHLVDIRASVLRTLTSMLHFDRNPNVPRPGSRLPKIIQYTGAERQGGILPLLVRDCIASLTNDGPFRKYPLMLATSLFSLLYHLASYEAGGHALVKSGMMQSLLCVISWPGVDMEHITFVTRAVRVIDLITNIDIAKFHQNNGLSAFIDRLEKEINHCRKVISDLQHTLVNKNEKSGMELQDVLPTEYSVEIDREQRSSCGMDVSLEGSNQTENVDEIRNFDNNDYSRLESSSSALAVDKSDVIIQYPSNSYYGRPLRERNLDYAVTLTSFSSKKVSCVTQRAALLKSMLNFLKKSIQDHTHFNGMRNIMETSLPCSLRHIISNAEYYGPSLFLLATDVVTVYVFNEPSLLSSLQDSGITNIILQSLLKKDVPATREVIGSLPNVFSALCLNERGLIEFMSYEPFDKLLKVLLSPDYLVAMRRRRSSDPLGDTATNLGNAMDDLMKHHPYLRTDAIEAIIRLLNELMRLGTDPSFICWRANKDNANVNSTSGTSNSNIVDSRISPLQNLGSVNVINEPGVNENENDSSGEEDDDDDEMSTASQQQRQNRISTTSQQQQLRANPQEREAIPLIDYILNVMKFIEAIFSNTSNGDHCREFVLRGGLKPLLQILSLPNLPIDSPVSTTAQAVANVCKSVLNLSHEIKVIDLALKELTLIVDKLNPLIKQQQQFRTSGGSVLLFELLSCPKIEDGFSVAEYTPLLHNMSSVHGYVVMLVHICRNASNDMRTILLRRWGTNSNTGLQLLQNLVQLYISLVWESTILLSLCSEESYIQNLDFSWDESTPPSAKEEIMKVEFEKTSASKSKLKQEEQLRYIKSLLAASSRLGRALAELFGTLVKICVGTPQSRQRRNNDFVTNISASKMPSSDSKEIAKVLSSILVNGFNHESILAKPAPKLKLTFLICSVGFTGPMLFDDKRSSFHLMISQFCKENGLKAFFDMFFWALSLDNCTSEFSFERCMKMENVLEDNKDDLCDYPEGTGEFLDAWLQLLEKMVNPKAILDSPYAISSKIHHLPSNVDFEPIFYLLQIHQLTLQTIRRIWKRKPQANYGVSMTETIMTILKHIIKSHSMLREKYKARVIEIKTASNIVQHCQRSFRPAPDEANVNYDHLQILTDMGFSKHHVLEALRITRSLEQATDYLLNHPEANSSASQSIDVSIQNAGALSSAQRSITDMEIDVVSAREVVDKEPYEYNTASSTFQLKQIEINLIPPQIFNDFCEETLQRIFELMERIPETVSTGAEVISVLYRRHNQTEKEKFVIHLIKDINDCTEHILRGLKHVNSSKSPKLEDLLYGTTSEKLFVRLKASTLLLDEIYADIRKHFCGIVVKEPCLNSLLKLLYKTEFILKEKISAGLKSTDPRWLQTLIEFIDAIDNVSVILQRKENMTAVCNEIWKWYDASTGKWNSYSEANNLLIRNAFNNGERSVAINIGRQRYNINFNCMTQVSETSGSHRPVLPSLKIIDSISMLSANNTNVKVENILTRTVKSKTNGIGVVHHDDLISLDALLNCNNDENINDNIVSTEEKNRSSTLLADRCEKFEDGLNTPTDLKKPKFETSPTNKTKTNNKRTQKIILHEETVGLSEFDTSGIISCLVRMLQPELQLQFEVKLSILRLCARLTKDYENAKIFVDRGGINILLNMRQNCGLMGFPTYAIIIIRHTLEAPAVLQESIERILSTRTCQSVPVGHRDLIFVLTQVSSAVARHPKLFTAAAEQVLRADYMTNPTFSIDDSRLLVKSLISPNRKLPISSDDEFRSLQTSIAVVKELLRTIVQPCAHYGCISAEEPHHDIFNDAEEASNCSQSKSSVTKKSTEKYEPSCCSWHIPSSAHVHQKLILPRSTLIKILADAVRSYQSLVPRVIIDHMYTPGDSSLIKCEQSCLSFILDRFIPITKRQQDAEVSMMSRVLIASLADCYGQPSVQIKLVEEIHNAIVRTLNQSNSTGKHTRLQVLIGLLPIMIESPMSANKMQMQRNCMYRILLRQGIMTDLSKIAQYKDLSNSNTLTTMHSILRPMEILLRLTVSPGTLSSKRIFFGTAPHGHNSTINRRYYPRFTTRTTSNSIGGENVLRDIIRNVLSDRRHAFDFIFNADDLLMDSDNAPPNENSNADDEVLSNEEVNSLTPSINGRSQHTFDRLWDDLLQNESLRLAHQNTNTNSNTTVGNGIIVGDHRRHPDNDVETGNDTVDPGSDGASSSSDTAATVAESATNILGEISTSESDSDSNLSTENDEHNDEDEDDEDDDDDDGNEGHEDHSETDADEETRQYIEVFDHIYEPETSESASNEADVEAEDDVLVVGAGISNTTVVRDFTSAEINSAEARIEEDQQNAIASCSSHQSHENNDIETSTNTANIQSSAVERNSSSSVGSIPTSTWAFSRPPLAFLRSDGNYRTSMDLNVTNTSGAASTSVHNEPNENNTPFLHINSPSNNSQTEGSGSGQRREPSRRLVFLDQQYCAPMPSFSNPTEEGLIELFNQDALHWWLEEAKYLDIESQTDACLYVAHLLIPFLIKELRRVQNQKTELGNTNTAPGYRRSAIPVLIHQSVNSAASTQQIDPIPSTVSSLNVPHLTIRANSIEDSMQCTLPHSLAASQISAIPQQIEQEQHVEQNVRLESMIDVDSSSQEQSLIFSNTNNDEVDDEEEDIYGDDEGADDENELNTTFMSDDGVTSNLDLDLARTTQSSRPHACAESTNVHEDTIMDNSAVSNESESCDDIHATIIEDNSEHGDVMTTEEGNATMEPNTSTSTPLTESDLFTSAISSEAVSSDLRHNESAATLMSPEVRAALGDLEVPDGVDPSFLAALPNEMRQEVIQEHLRLQRVRQRAQQTAIQVAHDSLLEVNPEFLAALPPNIQSEVLLQQRIEQQRQAAQSANPEDPVDTAAFFQNLPEALRQAILTDMEESQISSLPPDLAAEAQFLRRDWENRNVGRLDATQSNTLSGYLTSRFPSSLQNVSTGSRWHTNSIWYDANGISRSQQHQHTTVAHQHQSNGKPIALLLMEDENSLLDPDSLATLLLFLFIEDPKVNHTRFHRVVRNFCYHLPTREWVIGALISIIEKTNETRNNDSLKKNLKPHWLKLRVDAAFGYKSNVFVIHRSKNAIENNGTTTDYSININPQAAQLIVRNCLDMLFVLAKNFPCSFLPFNGMQMNHNNPVDISVASNTSSENIPQSENQISQDELRAAYPRQHQTNNRRTYFPTKQADVLDDSPSTSKAALIRNQHKSTINKSEGSLPKDLQYHTNGMDFWNVLLNIDAQTQKRLAHIESFPMCSQPPWKWKAKTSNFLSFNDSFFAKLLIMLPYKVICRSPTLTDMLVKLLASLSNDLPKEDETLMQTEEPPNSNADDSRNEVTLNNTTNPAYSKENEAVDENTPVSDDENKVLQQPHAKLNKKIYLNIFSQLQITIEVLTHKCGTTDGLDNIAKLIINLSNCSQAANAILLQYLTVAILGLAQEVREAIQSLLNEMRTYNLKNTDDCSTPQKLFLQNAYATVHQGVMQDRFTSKNVVISAPSIIKPSCELQLPAMKKLLISSSQSYFLRTLKIFMQIRELFSSNGNLVLDNALYNKQTLSQIICLDDLWNTLSDCLVALEASKDEYAVLVLQPTVEAFFLIHASHKKNVNNAEASSKYRNPSGVAAMQTSTSFSTALLPSIDIQTQHLVGENKPDMAINLLPSAAKESAFESLRNAQEAQMTIDRQKFLLFAEKHRTVLNQILRQSSIHLSDGPFAVLVDHTRILDFDVKRKYFQVELERIDEGVRREENTVSVRRVTVFEDSFRVLYRLGPEEWKNRFYIVFEDEEGQDAGGLLREWYVIISREIFNPMYALFCVSPGDRVTYMINPSSHANPNHLSYFKFVGRVIAKAIHDNKLLECYFTRSFYKHILGKQVKHTDMESQDYEFYKGLDYLMKNDISTLGYELAFSTEVQEFGVTQVRDLIPNGRDIIVTEENKFDYVQLVCQLKMSGSIRQQLDAFLEGFYDIIPKNLISIFNEQELELLISGLPDIDIEDLKVNTEYHKYTSKSAQIQWFWRALRSFDQADRAKFLQFVTGTSKVPLQGFGSLEGMNGIQKFQIHRDDRSTDRLPCAHTCFNQLDLPMYKSYDKLRNCLLKAIHECSEGFGFA